MVTCDLCPFVIPCWQGLLSVVYCWTCHALTIKHVERRQYLDGTGNWQEEDETTGYSTLACEVFSREKHDTGRPTLHGRLLDAFHDKGRCMRCDDRYRRPRVAEGYAITHYTIRNGQLHSRLHV